jgi:pilin isopeptide linkage protein
MKKGTRRILTLALTAIMIFAMMPFMPGAAQHANAEGTKSYSPKVVRVIENWGTVPSENVTVNLLADGKKVASVELDGAADEMKTDASTGTTCGETAKWVAVFKDLPAFDDTGHEIKYTVSEDPVTGLKSTITGPEQTASTTETYNITHTIDSSATIQPTVDVVWGDDLEKQPITFELKYKVNPSDKNMTTKTISLDGTADAEGENAAWHGSFQALPKYYSNGEAIKYKSRVATTNDSWTAEVTGSASEGYVVTINSKKAAKAMIKAIVSNGSSLAYDGQFEFTLKPADQTPDAPLPANAVVKNIYFGDILFGPIWFTTEGEYHYTITQNIPADATAENGYTANGITYDAAEWDVTVTVVADGNGNMTIKNVKYSKIAPIPETSYDQASFLNSGGTGNPNLTIDATKVWVPFVPNDARAYVKVVGKLPYNIVIYSDTFILDGETDTGETKLKMHPSSGPDVPYTCYAREDSPWHVTFSDLRNGSNIKYEIQEYDENGNDLLSGKPVFGNYVGKVVGGEIFNPEYNSDHVRIKCDIAGYIITNTSPTVTIPFTKKWSDSSASHKAVTIQLQRFSSGKWEDVTGRSVVLDGKPDTTADSEEDGEIDAWQGAFKALKTTDSETGKMIWYRVREKKVPSGYTCTVTGNMKDGFTVTNTNPTPSKIYPTVEKVWDSVSSDGKSVTLELQHNNGTAAAPQWEKVSEITLDGTKDEGVTASGTEKGEYEAWHGRFDGIDSSKSIYTDDYRVVETTKGDFQYAVTGSITKGFKVTNSRKASAVISGTKYLDKKPSSRAFSFELYEGKEASGSPVQTVKNASSGKITFDEISFDEAGTYYYTIHEKAGKKSSKIDFDEKDVLVKIEVTGEPGSLKASVSYSKAGSEISKAVFRNKTIKKTPSDNQNSGKTDGPGHSGSGKNAGVRTGDDSPLALSAAVFAIALAAVLALLRRRTSK